MNAVKINHANLRNILKRDAAAPVARIADRIAASASGQAGVIDGQGVAATRYDEQTPQRARSTIVLRHRTADGRAAANRAALAAMQTQGGVL